MKSALSKEFLDVTVVFATLLTAKGRRRFTRWVGDRRLQRKPHHTDRRHNLHEIPRRNTLRRPRNDSRPRNIHPRDIRHRRSCRNSSNYGNRYSHNGRCKKPILSDSNYRRPRLTHWWT